MDIMPLILFNEKVNRLERCRLAKRMATPKYKVQYDKLINREWIAFDDVSEDDIDAFVLNLRLLIQDKDGFSIRCLSKIYNKDGIPKLLTDAFNRQRQIWKSYRSSMTPFTKPDGGGKLSNGKLFDTMLYGGLAHHNNDKVNEFNILTKQGAVSAIVGVHFLSSLKTILNVLRNIKEINEKFIEVLKR
jgi:hypothetical protein